jgi:hypothetical protein
MYTDEVADDEVECDVCGEPVELDGPSSLPKSATASRKAQCRVCARLVEVSVLATFALARA